MADDVLGARVDRRRRAPGRSTIVHVAADLFDQNGYRAVTMEHLAAALKIAKPTLYNYAPSKSAIITWIIEEWTDEAEAALADAFNADTPTDRIRRLLVNWCGISARLSSSARLFEHGQREFPADAAAQYTSWQQSAFARIRSEIKRGIESGEFDPSLDPTVTTFALVALVNWTARWYNPGGPRTLDEIADQYWLLFSSGLLTSETVRTT